MTLEAVGLILGLVEVAIKEEPVIAAELHTLLSKPNPPPADWLAMKARVLGTSFESLAPNAKLS